MSKNESDLEYGECTSCGDGEDAKLGYYFWENEQYWFVECGECGYRTNEWGEANLAIDEWNGEEAEDPGEPSETVTTLVRLLAEKECENKDISKKFAEEQQVNENLRGILKDAQDKLDDNLVAKCARFEEVIKNLQTELGLTTEHGKNQKAACEKAHAEIQTERLRANDAESKIKDWENTSYLIDLALVSLGVAEEYPDTVTPPMTRQDLLDAIRDKQNWPPDNLTRTFDSPLGEIVWLSSPYGTHPAPGLYLRAINALLTTHEKRAEMINAVYGQAMERFGQGSIGYTLAWEALGRPGETKLDGRRPRST